MKTQTITFTAPHQIEIRERELAPLGAGQVLVQTLVSAVSPGTEMLLYRGQFPKEMAASADTISAALKYPCAYGYACVGKIVETGEQVERQLLNRLVFAFQPHTSFFVLEPAALLLLPEGISPETAAFLPNMETAVSLVQDLAPLLGERGLVFGQGIVGLLAASLLAEFPLAALVTVDKFPRRRAESRKAGATTSLDPSAGDFQAQVLQNLGGEKADFSLEISGAPAALNEAIGLTRFSGRIIVGSWYGEQQAPLNLGGDFHRSRIQIISSQVSAIRPELSGRWSKSRRFGVAWQALARIRPEKWVTQRVDIQQAPEIYRMLAENPSESIQVLFDY
ncbi:MAG: zinc-binding alcohol dehydrogenase [Anaerolineales bacterium]|jgi:2-desacetyl-2-hydroxyethyl bacteriochlorophyllide A dehydrogenase|nr:zinc-binding alcohol dehydrogenase [Anaerolineales bacterium]